MSKISAHMCIACIVARVDLDATRNRACETRRICMRGAVAFRLVLLTQRQEAYVGQVLPVAGMFQESPLVGEPLPLRLHSSSRES